MFRHEFGRQRGTYQHVNIVNIPILKAKEVLRLDRNSRVFRCRFICATVANAFSHPSYVQ